MTRKQFRLRAVRKKSCTARKRSISLIEVIIALVILSAIISGLVVSGVSHNQKSQFNQSRDRLQHLCLQAYRFSAMNIHVTTVVLQKKESQWEAYLSLWGDSNTMQRVTQHCRQLKDLKCIETISVDGESVSQLKLQFFGHEGLCRVFGQDAWDRDLPELDLIYAPGGTKPKIPKITLEAPFFEIDPTTRRKSKVTRELTLDDFAVSATQYPPFPNEYTHDE